jgi:hypothetical protein
MESPMQPVLQQPIRKTVGRQRTAFEKLAHLEDLTRFLRDNVEGAFTRVEGDYYPVRKSVGRARSKQS